MLTYSSEFQRNRRRVWIGRAKAMASGAFIVGAFLMASRWDEADNATVARAVDTGFKVLAERTWYRETLLSADHCRTPRPGETLVMKLADKHAPGRGFECEYWSGVGYGDARRLAQVEYSRGRRDE